MPPALSLHAIPLADGGACLEDVKEALGEETVQRAAIYSAGCMLFKMLTDHRLFCYGDISSADDNATEAAWVGLLACFQQPLKVSYSTDVPANHALNGCRQKQAAWVVPRCASGPNSRFSEINTPPCQQCWMWSWICWVPCAQQSQERDQRFRPCCRILTSSSSVKNPTLTADET